MRTVIPYKDSFTRSTILFLGVLLIVMLNGIFYVGIAHPEYVFVYFLFLLAVARLYWTKRKDFSGLTYCISSESIDIKKGTKTIKKIDKKAIQNVSYPLSLSRSDRWGVIPKGTDFHARLSIENVSMIELNTGERVWLSGRIDE